MRFPVVFILLSLSFGCVSHSFADDRYDAAVIFVPEITVMDAKRCESVFLRSKKDAVRNVKLEALGGEDLESYLIETENFWAAVSRRATKASHETNLYSAGRLIKAPDNFDYSWFNDEMSDVFIASECGKISGFARRAVSLKPQTAVLSSVETREFDDAQRAKLSHVPYAKILDCSAASLVEFQENISLKGSSPDASPERLSKARSWMLVLEKMMNEDKSAASAGGKSTYWDSLVGLGVEGAKSAPRWMQISEGCLNDHN